MSVFNGSNTANLISSRKSNLNKCSRIWTWYSWEPGRRTWGTPWAVIIINMSAPNTSVLSTGMALEETGAYFIFLAINCHVVFFFVGTLGLNCWTPNTIRKTWRLLYLWKYSWNNTRFPEWLALYKYNISSIMLCWFIVKVVWNSQILSEGDRKARKITRSVKNSHRYNLLRQWLFFFLSSFECACF